MSVDPNKTAERIQALASSAAAHRTNLSQIRGAQPPVESWMGADTAQAVRGQHTLAQVEQVERATTIFRQSAWPTAQKVADDWRKAEGRAGVAVRQASKASREAIDPGEFDNARIEVRASLNDGDEGAGYGERVLRLYERYSNREDWASLKALRYEAGQHLTELIGDAGYIGTDRALVSQARQQLRGMQLPGEAELAEAEANQAAIKAQKADLDNAVREVAREAGGNPEMWLYELQLAKPVAQVPLSEPVAVTASGAEQV